MKKFIFIIGLLALGVSFAYADAGIELVNGITQGTESATKQGMKVVNIIAKGLGVFYLLVCLLGAYFSSVMQQRMKEHLFVVISGAIILTIVIAVTEFMK